MSSILAAIDLCRDHGKEARQYYDSQARGGLLDQDQNILLVHVNLLGLGFD